MKMAGASDDARHCSVGVKAHPRKVTTSNKLPICDWVRIPAAEMAVFVKGCPIIQCLRSARLSVTPFRPANPDKHGEAPPLGPCHQRRKHWQRAWLNPQASIPKPPDPSKLRSLGSRAVNRLQSRCGESP